MNAPDDTLVAGVRPGDILAGKYRVERLLGVGGMGVCDTAKTSTFCNEPSCLGTQRCCGGGVCIPKANLCM
jgi:hypothetical protein